MNRIVITLIAVCILSTVVGFARADIGDFTAY